MTPRKAIGLGFTLVCALVVLVGYSVLQHQPLASAPPRLPPQRQAVSRALPPPPHPPPISDRRSQDSIQKASTPPLSETNNILLAGLDSRPSWQGGRTDALVVAVLDRRSNHAGLVSVPRDLLVSWPPSEQSGDQAAESRRDRRVRRVRINTVYQRAGGGEAGVAALRLAVGRVLGLVIEHVVIVDHAGFEALIDELGGVSVVVQCPLVERFVDRQRFDGHRMLRLQTVLQRMDGATALMFARARHGRGIFDRARRQQALLDGLRRRLLDLGLSRARQLLPALRKAVYADMTTLEILQLARRVSRLKKERLHGLVIDSRQARPTTIAGRWVLIPDPARIRAALAELFSAARPGKRRWPGCPPADAGFRARATKGESS